MSEEIRPATPSCPHTTSLNRRQTPKRPTNTFRLHRYNQRHGVVPSSTRDHPFAGSISAAYRAAKYSFSHSSSMSPNHFVHARQHPNVEHFVGDGHGDGTQRTLTKWRGQARQPWRQETETHMIVGMPYGQRPADAGPGWPMPSIWNIAPSNTGSPESATA